VNSNAKVAAVTDDASQPLPSTCLALAPTLPASLAVVAATGAFAGELDAALWSMLCAWLLVDPLLGSLVASLSWLRAESGVSVSPHAGQRWRSLWAPIVLSALMLVLATFYGRWPLLIGADALILALLLVWLLPISARRLAIEALQASFGWTLVAQLQGRLDIESAVAGACLGLTMGLASCEHLVGRVIAGVGWLALFVGAILARQPLVAGLLGMIAIPALGAKRGAARCTAQKWPQLLAIALTALAFWARA